MNNSVGFSIDEFLSGNNTNLLAALNSYHLACMNEPAAPSQVKAWSESIDILKNSLSSLCASEKEIGKSFIAFEYELPRERGRRPDVLLLFRSSILVIEFKQHSLTKSSFVDQVSAYARDLHNYHEYSHDIKFIPVLILTRQKNLLEDVDDVLALSPDKLTSYLTEFWESEKHHSFSIDYSKWMTGDYAPLPSLVEAARTIFKHEPLPNIRRAASAGIPNTLKQLHQIAETARNRGEHHLALITGVPGAGKTLVGISFVYEVFNRTETLKEAVLLSGNGPLVEVLQYALKSSVFVQDVHGFLKSYGGSKNTVPRESIFIYDEAQRAWDKARVSEKRGHAKSEPEDFLSIGAKKEWCLMVGLIGEGQEIHIGEEAGLTQWNDAIASNPAKWIVHCPQHVSQLFKDASAIHTNNDLNLNQSLRTHLAEDVQSWVNAVLDGSPEVASGLSTGVHNQGFDIYLTRSLEDAKSYAQERYSSDPNKKYGLIASSKSKILPSYGVMNDYFSTQKVRKGPWYIDDRTSPQSCCQMERVVTEFGVQGLELDLPIVCWEDDFVYRNGKWEATKTTRNAVDSFQLRKNSYRVLLSRGRDGMVLFIPPNQSLDTTYSYLKDCGLRLNHTF